MSCPHTPEIIADHCDADVPAEALARIISPDDDYASFGVTRKSLIFCTEEISLYEHS